MKIKELKGIIYSWPENTQWVEIWDPERRATLVLDTAENVIEKFGELDIKQLIADRNDLQIIV